jgi:hypothetical protein
MGFGAVFWRGKRAGAGRFPTFRHGMQVANEPAMLNHSEGPATGTLTIVEAGANVPGSILSHQQTSDHAVIRQSDGESLGQVLRRAQRRGRSRMRLLATSGAEP